MLGRSFKKKEFLRPCEKFRDLSAGSVSSSSSKLAVLTSEIPHHYPQKRTSHLEKSGTRNLAHAPSF